MNRHEITKFVNYLEEKYPVNLWKIDNILIWPILRLKIGFLLYSKDLPNSHSTIKTQSYFFKTKIFMYGLTEWLRFFVYTTFSDVEFVFSGKSSHRTKIGPQHYNRFYGPLIDINAIEKKKFLQFEQDVDLRRGKLLPKGNILITPWMSSFYFFFFNKFSARKSNQHLPRIDEFLEEVNGVFCSDKKKLTLNLIVNSCNTIYQTSQFYLTILKFIKPKVVFVLCYYTTSHFGLVHAANTLGISTIDIQHGSQGENHLSYGSWSNVPNKGYSTIPRIFWNWDGRSAEGIKKWSKEKNSETFVGGNIWMNAWQEEAWISKYYGKLEKVRFSLPLILYSLQPVVNPIPQIVVDLVKATKGKFQWVFRIHPRQFNDLDKIEELILAEGINNYLLDLKQSFDYPLPFLLKKTVLHVTQWSSVVMEAAEYGIPSLVVHINGFHMFEKSYPNLYYLGYNINSLEDCVEILKNLKPTRGGRMESNIKGSWQELAIILGSKA